MAKVGIPDALPDFDAVINRAVHPYHVVVVFVQEPEGPDDATRDTHFPQSCPIPCTFIMLVGNVQLDVFIHFFVLISGKSFIFCWAFGGKKY